MLVAFPFPVRCPVKIVLFRYVSDSDHLADCLLVCLVVLKKRNVWVTVSLGAVMLLFNLSNLPNNYYYFLPFYIFVALLLIFQVNMAKQNENAGKRRGGKSVRTTVYLTLAVFFVALLVVSVAWVSRNRRSRRSGSNSIPALCTMSIRKKTGLNIFSNVQDKWTWVESKSENQLLFTAGQNESETILYLITSDKPVYLLTRRYDTYNSWGWTSNPTVDKSVSAGTSVTENTPNTPTQPLNYSVENRAKSDVILTTGQFISADIPVTLKAMPPDPDNTDQIGDIMAVTSPWVISPYQRYSVVNNVPLFTPEQLSAVIIGFPDAIAQQYLQLPDDFPYNVKNLSQDLVKHANTEYAKLMAIKKYLNTLEYDRKGSVPTGSEDAVAQFLYSTKKVIASILRLQWSRCCVRSAYRPGCVPAIYTVTMIKKPVPTSSAANRLMPGQKYISQATAGFRWRPLRIRAPITTAILHWIPLPLILRMNYRSRFPMILSR